jgi:hypothetical protein
MAWQCTSPGSGEKGIFLRNGYNNIQELRSSSRNSFRHALELYGLLQDGQLHQQKFKDSLDIIVDAELDLLSIKLKPSKNFRMIGIGMESNRPGEYAETIHCNMPKRLKQLRNILDMHPMIMFGIFLIVRSYCRWGLRCHNIHRINIEVSRLTRC